MTLPGFAAEVALYTPRRSYRGLNATCEAYAGASVVPTQIMDPNYACIAAASATYFVCGVGSLGCGPFFWVCEAACAAGYAIALAICQASTSNPTGTISTPGGDFSGGGFGQCCGVLRCNKSGQCSCSHPCTGSQRPQ
jgi:hypothetical protein